jgi:hypothetical protein
MKKLIKKKHKIFWTIVPWHRLAPAPGVEQRVDGGGSDGQIMRTAKELGRMAKWKRLNFFFFVTI